MRIDLGREGFAIQRKEREGRISYENGIAKAMEVFQKVQALVEPDNMILAEYTFLSQELSCCDKNDIDSLNSLTRAIADFDDAFLALKTVEDKTLYQGAETTYPHRKEYRESGVYPKDAYNIACNSHRTRIKNILRAPGIDPIEKALLKQRLANLTTAQNSYIEKQRKVLSK
jgi:hypothetical protein